MCKTEIDRIVKDRGLDSKSVVSWDELDKHCTPEDLWVAIEGKAYNVTKWRLDHPGGWRQLDVGHTA